MFSWAIPRKVGRTSLLAASERVIGPSDWTNTARTFDAVRLDVHQTGYKVSLFALSVVGGVDGAMAIMKQVILNAVFTVGSQNTMLIARKGVRRNGVRRVRSQASP
jgi:hypothetical protein